MRRRRKPLPVILIGLLIIVAGVFLTKCAITSFSSDDPEEVVREFYNYEKEGDFGSSWELFHSEMQKRFSKGDYIQTKNHVFIGHMGVETFEVEIGEIENIGEWEYKRGDEVDTFTDVKAAEVDMIYESDYGLMTISQVCYVAQEKGEWKVLWDYNF
jgi:hypothetical protein